MLKRITALLLAALLIAVTATAGAVSADHRYDFDLTFHMDASAYPEEDQSIISGLADFLEITRMTGSLYTGEQQTFDLVFDLILQDDESTRQSYRLFGVPSHYALTTSLLGDSVLLINNLGMLEFAMKAFYHLDMPLQNPALLVSPYVHTSAFEWILPKWQETFHAEEGSRQVSYDQVMSLAHFIAENAENDRAFYYWVEAIGNQTGYEDGILEGCGSAPEWVESWLSEDGIRIEEDKNGSETWTSGDLVLYEKDADGMTVRLPASVNESSEVILSVRNEGQDRLAELSISQEEEPRIMGSLRVSLADGSASAFNDGVSTASFRYEDSLYGTQLAFDWQLETKGDEWTLTQLNPESGEPMLTAAGTVREAEAEPREMYLATDILEIPGIINVLSVDDESLAALVNQVKDTFLDQFLPILVRVPASSYASLFDFLNAYSILDVLTAGLE